MSYYFTKTDEVSMDEALNKVSEELKKKVLALLLTLI